MKLLMKEKKELLEELTPLIEERIEWRVKIMMTDILKNMLESNTYSTLKLSELSFKKLWENEKDAIWDTY